ncbi:hypothetical protein JCM21900_006992 [Sporobolomyces salmonicolor]
MIPTLLRRAACSSAAAAPALPPVRWTYLPRQIPYALGLLLQESLVQARLSAKAALLAPSVESLSPSETASLRRVAETDLLLLLQHTPVFTSGRREKDPVQAEQERERLGRLGADYVQTMRGGQTTYHGPGQLVGYPLMDLGPAKLSTRCYVDRLESFLSRLTTTLSVPVHPLEHTGVFVSPTSKIGSIGIHIRRRITLHGFSLNVEQQTKAWFDQIVACGLADVSSTSVEAELRRLGKLGRDKSKLVLDVVPTAVELFGELYGREMRRLEEGDDFVEARRMIEDSVEGRLPSLKKELLGV